MTKDHDNSKGLADGRDPTFEEKHSPDANPSVHATSEIARLILSANVALPDELIKLARFAVVFCPSTSPMTPDEGRDSLLGMDLMVRLWFAGIATGIFELDDVLDRGCCLTLAPALHDALHALGRKDAVLLRTGLNFSSCTYGELYDASTVGHPAAGPSPYWNAHMTVQLGNLIFDPTLCQMRFIYPDLPYVGVFRRHEGVKPTFDLHDHGQVDAIASGTWGNHARSFAVRLFPLSREVDLSTRKWKTRPGANRKQRAELVKLMLELIEHFPLPLFMEHHD